MSVQSTRQAWPQHMMHTISCGCTKGCSHRRTGQHPFGGADRVLPEWIQWGGVVADIFRDPYSVGGGSSRNFPGSILCGVAGFFPLTAVTDPKFVLFKHVLCFARIMSTLCPNSCRQTARIGGAAAPPCPPVPYAYGCSSIYSGAKENNTCYLIIIRLSLSRIEEVRSCPSHSRI